MRYSSSLSHSYERCNVQILGRWLSNRDSGPVRATIRYSQSRRSSFGNREPDRKPKRKTGCLERQRPSVGRVFLSRSPGGHLCSQLPDIRRGQGKAANSFRTGTRTIHFQQRSASKREIHQVIDPTAPLRPTSLRARGRASKGSF